MVRWVHTLIISTDLALGHAAMILASFRALSNCPVQSLRQHSALSGSQHVSMVGRLLSSPNPNVQYACVTCLLVLDTSLWAGTAGDIPSAFDESQVHTIMGLLDSPDNLIRMTVDHPLWANFFPFTSFLDLKDLKSCRPGNFVDASHTTTGLFRLSRQVTLGRTCP